jgi:hypothetical protein
MISDSRSVEHTAIESTTIGHMVPASKGALQDIHLLWKRCTKRKWTAVKYYYYSFLFCLSLLFFVISSFVIPCFFWEVSKGLRKDMLLLDLRVSHFFPFFFPLSSLVFPSFSLVFTAFSFSFSLSFHLHHSLGQRSWRKRE